jgi:hypothetical protein
MTCFGLLIYFLTWLFHSECLRYMHSLQLLVRAKNKSHVTCQCTCRNITTEEYAASMKKWRPIWQWLQMMLSYVGGSCSDPVRHHAIKEYKRRSSSLVQLKHYTAVRWQFHVTTASVIQSWIRTTVCISYLWAGRLFNSILLLICTSYYKPWDWRVTELSNVVLRPRHNSSG